MSTINDKDAKVLAAVVSLMGGDIPDIDYNALAPMIGHKYARNARAAVKKIFEKLKNVEGGPVGGDAAGDEDGNQEKIDAAPKAKGKKASASKKDTAGDEDGDEDQVDAAPKTKGKKPSAAKKESAAAKVPAEKKSPVKKGVGKTTAPKKAGGGKKKTSKKGAKAKSEDGNNGENDADVEMDEAGKSDSVLEKTSSDEIGVLESTRAPTPPPRRYSKYYTVQDEADDANDRGMTVEAWWAWRQANPYPFNGPQLDTPPTPE